MEIDPNLEWLTDQLAIHRIPKKDLAQAIGIDPSGLSRLLRGNRRLKQAEIQSLHLFLAQFNTQGLTPPSRFAGALSRREISTEELSVSSGIGVTRLLQIKYGQGVPVRRDEKQRLGTALGEDSDVIFPTGPASRGIRGSMDEIADGPPTRGGGVLVTPDMAVARDERLPVYRPLPLTPTGWQVADFVVSEWREPPPCLKGVDAAYGVYVDGQGQPPYFMAGERYWVHPGRPVPNQSRALAWRDDRTVVAGMIEYVQGERVLSFGTAGYRLKPTDRIERIVLVEAA